MMMLAVMTAAEPAYVERCGVIVVMGHDVSPSALLTGLRNKIASDFRGLDQDGGAPASRAEVSSVLSAIGALFGAVAFAPAVRGTN